MQRKIAIFIAIIIITTLADQAIKYAIIALADSANPIAQSAFIDIVLVYNKGIAFSFASFLGGVLKWILLAVLCAIVALILKSKDFFALYYAPLGVIVGGGAGNLIDRFCREGVVDYIYWHYGFNFAVFNFADSAINVSIAVMIILELRKNLARK